MSSSTSMKAYLAAHYMSGAKAEAITARLDPAAKKKKKKAKAKAADSNAASTSFIKDMDEDLRWGKPVDEEEDDEEKAVVEKDRSFKKRKVEAAQANDGGGWIKVQGEDGNDGAVEEVAMEEAVAAPAAGLVLPSQFKSALPPGPEKKKKKSKRTGDDDGGDEQGETVYRDASGRKIQVESAEDIAARQAEEEREKRQKEREKKEWQKGLVQREQAEARRREEEKERSRGMASRRADDKELNEAQKAEERWNDPAAAFLTKKEKKGPKRPAYKGPPPPPNRFGIKPGYRWDGVDRSNGFEKKYFQTINEKGRTKLEAYQWSVDDM